MNSPFLTPYDWNSDYSDVDHAAEFEKWSTRNAVISDFIEGSLPAEAVLETLLDQDIDPYVYVESVEEAVKYCLEHPELNLSIEYE